MHSPLLDPGNAPLTEVALTLQFESLAGFLGPVIGTLWSESFRSEYPQVEQHPPIDQVLELERAPLPQPQVRLSSEVPHPRYFFVSQDEAELIQLQNDRISFNWRRRGEGYNYPRYPVVRERFEQAFNVLQEFVEREKLGEIIPNQCELLYANVILYRVTELPHRHLGDLIKPWSGYEGLGDAQFEDVRIHSRHVLRGPENRFLGRLHVNVDPAYLVKDRTPAYKIQLTARGGPLTADASGAFAFLDLAHERLRTAFSELFSEEVQKEWMEKHGS